MSSTSSSRDRVTYTLGHRAMLPVVRDRLADGGEILARIRQTVRAWLETSRDTGLVLSTGVHDLAGGKTLAVASVFDDGSGAEVALRVQFGEDRPAGQWRTTVTACVPASGDDAYVGVDREY